MALATLVSRRTAALIVIAAFALAGCESLGLAPGKKIDYKSTGTAPALEIPPELSTPAYDDRYNVATASGQQARDAVRRSSGNELLPVNADAKIVRAGSERWLVVKATPEQAWSTVRQFWTDTGFTVAQEQPNTGVMETDWAENRAEIPGDFLRNSVGKYVDMFYTTYKRDKFRTRIERGVEPGTVEIYVSHRGMEQVPTAKIDNSSPAAFAWAVMPPNPQLEAEMLTRMMQRFGTPQLEAAAAVTNSANAPPKAVVEKGPDGVSKLYVDDTFDRAWRRVGLALDRTGFTVVDRDRSTGVYFVRYADPEASAKQTGWLDKLMFWKTDEKDRPEQYRILVADAAPRSVVTVQDPMGAPDRTPSSDRILTLLRDQLR